MTLDTQFDFIILTLPRSGSFMLASAMDSHPEIQCTAEAWCSKPHGLGVVDKRLKGTTVFPRYMDQIIGKPKVVVLLRDSKNRFPRYDYDHFEAPTTRARVDVSKDTMDEFVQEADYEALQLSRIASGFDSLSVSYEEITGDKDCREIPEKIARRLCDFLCISHRPLVTKFYKPSVSN